MNKFKYMMRHVYRAPMADDAGAGGGGGKADDRGDDFTPTPEDEAAAAAAEAAKGKKEPTDEEAEAERAKLGLAGGKKPEDEQTEEEKAAAAEAAAKEAKDGKKDTRIPLARHTEILGRERAQREALEAQVAQLQQGVKVAKTNEEISKLEEKVVDLETKYAEALADGKTKEATGYMKEIRQAERTIIEQKAEFRTQVATAQAVETVRFDATIERLEAAYPQLKPGSETFDKDVVAEVLDLQAAFEAKGMAPSAALQKAVGYVIKPETAKQEAATTVTPRVTDEAAAKAKAERETAARKTAAAASNAQPPSTAAAGANSDAAGGVLDAKTAIKLPFDKFKALSDDDLSRMRGDTV